MDHIPTVHTDCGHSGSCMICDGGLFLCTICGALEGGLTTDCCGIRLSWNMTDHIYGGRLDYTDGQWQSGDKTHPPINTWRR